MTAWGSLDTWWENFGHWLSSDQGQLTCSILLVAVVLIVLYVVSRRLSKRVDTLHAEAAADKTEKDLPAWPEDEEQERE